MKDDLIKKLIKKWRSEMAMWSVLLIQIGIQNVKIIDI